MTTLVTGAAGFIGSHVTLALLARGERVIGLDNFYDYYSPARKRANPGRGEPVVNRDLRSWNTSSANRLTGKTRPSRPLRWS